MYLNHCSNNFTNKTQLISLTTPWDKYYYYLYFIDQECEALAHKLSNLPKDTKTLGGVADLS